MENDVKTRNIQVVADDHTKQGAYCNLGMITHTPEEFVADFLFIMPQPPYGKLHSRILMSPGHAKRFMAALADNIHKFE